jgi:phenylalanyl-tRNA synthetase beta chain
MKLSEQWLREWVNPPLDINELAEQLTLAGLEVESLGLVSGHFNKVVVGHVISVSPHPDASRLQVCQLDIGAETLLSIVCGATVRAGLRVAVACIGATLPNDLNIKALTVRGVLSQGMLCSSSELGLANESQGILELPLDAPLGRDLRDYLQLNDQYIDIHVTPNRGDCLSVQGLARELAALTQQTFLMPTIPSVTADIPNTLKITIQSGEDCPCYLGRIIQGINPQAQTPIWMRERLRRSGFRSIHPVVDVTNYVMLELGQPLHAFDLVRLNSEIFIRRANEGEKFCTLQGKEMHLDQQTLVIADKTQVQAIAGIMGGLDSAVSAETSDIFLESAFFNPAVLAGRARFYGLSSESAYRFERGVDPNLASLAIERATQLLIDIVGGKNGPVVSMDHAAKKQVSPINLHQSQIKKILGLSLKENEIEAILQRLGMLFTKRQAEENSWQVQPPTWRFDIRLEVDLIEELARVHGYAKIPVSCPRAVLHFSAEPAFPLNRLRQFLVDRDYQEAITYSFISPQLQKQCDPEALPLTLLNPISSELSVMRTSLWPGLLNAAVYNQKRQQLRVRLFETGLCFLNHGGQLLQVPYLAAIATGDSATEQWGIPKKPLDFFTIKSDVEALFRSLGQLSSIQFVPGKHPALHPGQTSKIMQETKTVGYVAALHPKLLADLDLIGPVYLFELSLDVVTRANLPCFKPFSKFPMVRRDLAFWVEEKFPAQIILEQVKAKAGILLADCYLFDVYHDKKTEKGRRSLALALLWQHQSRTLIDSEVDHLLQQVITELKQHFAIQLRE